MLTLSTAERKVQRCGTIVHRMRKNRPPSAVISVHSKMRHAEPWLTRHARLTVLTWKMDQPADVEIKLVIMCPAILDRDALA